MEVFRLPALALLSALSAALGLAIYISSGPVTTLGAASQAQHNQLAAISERAERIRAYSRYIRKASLTGPASFDLPFGGFVGSADRVEPGAKIEISENGFAAQTLEIVSVEKIPAAFQLTANTSRDVELLLVSGRISGGSNGSLVRFLVAASAKSPSNTATDLRTL
jgi:hypothetical protein